MKKLILVLLFIPLISFSQNFRKMSFGQSVKELKETYPETEFTFENASGISYIFLLSLYLVNEKKRKNV